ncbi:DUF1292 domain-containing protein [Evansella cellulosilytica]|uniref:DUF1292 domain-containing protein n=1 Tax=Evansella cellulosilytica (strain ATCC 21833 / DSM 2522 / FERM P-1141 / JCM 9156 / N-4) TaxID=649639 RepID=E6TRY3_EVAC2|nr:DUF1292 domain-containing protein [Evansella cellulosilytica]ADU30637.1 protein of unknown function DUF1292 [Evansella cellulosilytica DSM 2522]
MDFENIRDQITIEDDKGNHKDFNVEALFEMDGQSYALITGDYEALLMRIEEDTHAQYLVGITDPTEREAILEAYEIAVEASPAEKNNE